MNYLSQMIDLPVYDSEGEEIGKVNDVGIATGEVFPRITSLAFKGPAKTPFMVSWRKYVESINDEGVRLMVPARDIRFSYLQPSELLLRRDLMDKQIVDTQGMRVVRVNDLKISLSGTNELRLVGAEVGIRGILRGISPKLERAILKIAGAFGIKIPEKLIAWNYMDLLHRDLSQVKLSVSHKRLDELHPADVADIIEQLDPRLRASIFNQLETSRAADTMAEMEEEFQAGVIEGLSDRKASDMIASMDPDDAADLIGELSYDKAERLLKLMGINEQRTIRKLLGYKDNTAGGIMTTEVVALEENKTAQDAIEALRNLDEAHESVYNVYTTDENGVLKGVLSMRDLAMAKPDQKLAELAFTDLITIDPEEDQEEVALSIARYDLIAMPVVDDNHVLLGIVTVDDALEVMQQEHAEDLQIAGAVRGLDTESAEEQNDLTWFLKRGLWVFIWILIIVILFLIHTPFATFMLAPLPIVLLVAADTTSFSLNKVLEATNEGDEEKAKGYPLRNIAIGIVMGVVFFLVCMIALVILDPIIPQPIAHALSYVLGSTAVVIGLIISLSTVLMRLVRTLDENDKEFSSTLLAAIFMVLAGLLFAGLTIAFFMAGGVDISGLF